MGLFRKMSSSSSSKPRSPDEIDRAISLPFRDNRPTIDLTDRLALPDGEMTLRPIQSQALAEIEKERGGILSIGVGGGKTLIAYLTPEVLGVHPDETLVILPANLRDPFIREGVKYRRHFRVPDRLRVISYTEMSHKNNANLLEELRPKLIIADEAHRLKSTNSTRTKRLIKYFRSYPDTMLVAMSGTLMPQSVMDAQHLVHFALGERSPLPRGYRFIKPIAEAVDGPRAHSGTSPMTDLQRRMGSSYARRFLNPFSGERVDKAPLERRDKLARSAFHRRFFGTSGVIGTQKSSVDIPVVLREVDTTATSDILGWLEELRSSWTSVEAGELVDELQVSRSAKALALGYDYYWHWENGYNAEWDSARLQLARLLRRYVQRTGIRSDVDSPARAIDHIRAGLCSDRELVEAYYTWEGVKDDEDPEPRFKVLSHIPIRDIVDRQLEHLRRTKQRGIIWYSTLPQAQILEDLGVKVMWAGEDVVDEGEELLALSSRSHSEGLNLQGTRSHNLILEISSSSARVEQMIGRTHRPGQEKSQVEVWVLCHTQELDKALRNCISDAIRTRDTTGQSQKILIGSWEDRLRKRI